MKNTKAVTYFILCLFSIPLIFHTASQGQDALANNMPREASTPNGCAKGLVPIIKKRTSALVCVQPATVTKLLARGWGTIPTASTAVTDETSSATSIEAITETNTITGTDVITGAGIIGVNAITKTFTITSAQEIIVTHKDNVVSALCGPDEIAKIVTDFLDAFNQGDRDALGHFFGENFQMYIAGEHDSQQGRRIRHVAYMAEESRSLGGTGTVRSPRSEVINQLLDYFAARHGQHEQMHLLEIASIDGSGEMAYKIQRRADDLDAELWGPDFIARGNGAVNCRNQTIDAWIMTMSTPRPSAPEAHDVIVCPTPAANWSEDAVLACSSGWR